MGPWYAHVNRNPGWVTGIAFFTAVLVVVVPLLLLFAAAMLVGLVVFVTLGLIARIATALRFLWVKATPGSGGLGLNQGRRNVRVIRPD